METYDRPLDFDSALRNTEWVRRLTRSLARDPDAAAELEQETWLAALSSPRGPRENVRAWLRSIARNLVARRETRSAGRLAAEREHARGDAEVATDELVEHADLLRKVLDEVMGLDEPYRSTVLLRYFEGCEFDEIGRRTGIPASTARTRLARAQDALRQRLDAEYADRHAWLAVSIGMLDNSAVELAALTTKTKVGLVIAATVIGVVVATTAFDQADPEPATPPVQAASLDEPVASTSDEPRPVGSSVLGAPRGTEQRASINAPVDAPPIRLSGHVENENGQRLSGAEVVAVPATTFGGVIDSLAFAASDLVDERRVATTAPDGSFAFSRLDGRVLLSVRAEGHATLDTEVLLPEDGSSVDVGALVVPDGVTLSGYVFDEAGRGVGGISLVRFLDPMGVFAWGPNDHRRVTIAVTNEDGSFRSTGFPTGSWHLTLIGPGHFPQHVRGEDSIPGLSAGHVFLLEEGIELTGRIAASGMQFDDLFMYATLVDGQDVSELTRPRTSWNERNWDYRQVTTRCDADGTFSFGLFPQEALGLSYTITARHDAGWFERFQQPAVGSPGGQPIELHLDSQTVVFGLRDASTDASLDEPRAFVSFWREGFATYPRDVSSTLRRRDDGRFEVALPRPKSESTLGLKLQHDGFETFAIRDVGLGPPSDLGWIRLDPRPVIDVTVVGPSGSPISDAEVTMVAESALAPGAQPRTRMVEATRGSRSATFAEQRAAKSTDEAGVARVPVLADEVCHVVVAHPNFAAAHLALEPGAEPGVRTVRLSPGGTVEVRILYDGEPLEQRTVTRIGDREPSAVIERVLDPIRTNTESKATNRDGIVAFELLHDGRHGFRLEPDGDRFAGTSEINERFNVDSTLVPSPLEWIDIGGEDRHELAIEVPLWTTLTGAVTHEGRAVANAAIKLVQPGKHPTSEFSIHRSVPSGYATETDTDGTFRIERIAAGIYELQAHHPSVALYARRPVELVRGTHDITLELPETTVRGRVVDEAGTPLTSAIVVVCKAGDGLATYHNLTTHGWPDLFRATHSGSIWSDAVGEFELRGLPEGTPLRVVALAEDRAPGLGPVFEVPGGETVLLDPLMLTPSGSVDIRLTGERQGQYTGSLFLRRTPNGLDDPEIDERVVKWNTTGNPIHHLAPGTWTIVPGTRKSERDGVVVEVRAGETTSVDYPLPGVTR